MSSTIRRALATVRSTLARFARSRRGVSAVEFALLLPPMLLLYAGSIELSEALSVDRKVNRLASTVGDLVTQRSEVKTTDLTEFFSAAQAIMQPYSTTPVRILVMAVNIVDTKDPPLATSQTVAWAAVNIADAGNVKPAKDSATPIVVPPSMVSAGSQVVVTRVKYEFESPFSSFMKKFTGRDKYSISHVFIMHPRLGSKIEYTAN